MIAGVAEGLARHVDVDPLLIRVLLGALTVFGGAGIVLYLVAWVTIPRDDEHDSLLSRPLRRDPERVMTAGLAVAAVVAAATMVGAISFGAPNPIPVLVVSLVAIAGFMVISRRSDRVGELTAARTAQFAVSDDASAGGVPSDTAAGPEGFAETATDVLPVRPGDGSGATGYLPPTPGVPAPPPRRPKAPRSHLFAMTMAVTAIALGALWVYDEAGHEVATSVYPGTALAVIALGLIIGAWWGRSRLLIVAGLVATFATIVATVIGPGPNGDRTYAPTSTAQLRNTYSHGAGRIVVHLEDLVDPASLNGRTIHIESGVGQVEVTVPSSIDVAVNADVDHGDIRGLTAEQHLDQGEERVDALPGTHDATVDIDLRFGQILVERVDCPGTTVPADSPITLTTPPGGTDVPAACN
jgi:phage shock protein PspC (stress-responsive transcriptional regulator)/FtsH-binding integral membrane protein